VNSESRRGKAVYLGRHVLIFVVVLLESVEARLVPKYDVNIGQVKKQIKDHILSTTTTLACETLVQGWQHIPLLHEYVDSIRVCESCE
jgi:hypothetical protein